MRAQIHPNPDEIVDVNKAVSLRMVKKHARTRRVGTAILANVTLSDSATGELKGEYDEVVPLESMELPGPVVKMFRKMDFDGHFYDAKTHQPVDTAKVVIAVGKEIFYLPHR